jgi:transcriptional regulator with XRE-family HTH domain
MKIFSKIFVQNVRFILKQKNIKKGEFEKSLGLSPGFFSRADKRDIEIGLEVVVGASKSLNIPIEDLLDEVVFRKEYLETEIEKKREELATLEAELAALTGKEDVGSL